MLREIGMLRGMSIVKRWIVGRSFLMVNCEEEFLDDRV
jgi:hypothetical protein